MLTGKRSLGSKAQAKRRPGATLEISPDRLQGAVCVCNHCSLVKQTSKASCSLATLCPASFMAPSGTDLQDRSVCKHCSQPRFEACLTRFPAWFLGVFWPGLCFPKGVFHSAPSASHPALVWWGWWVWWGCGGGVGRGAGAGVWGRGGVVVGGVVGGCLGVWGWGPLIFKTRQAIQDSAAARTGFRSKSSPVAV